MLRRLWEMIDDFPPGRVPLLLIIFAGVSGVLIGARSFRSVEPRLTVWIFTHIAYEEYSHRLADVPGGDEVKVRNLGAALFDRLALAIMTQTELPDLVEIEQGHVGRFLRGPVEHLPFVDLTDRIHGEGWDEKCVAARFAKYAVNGRIFGIPHDIHPMVLVYRPDVLAELGYTPADLATWDGFLEAARAFHRPGRLGTPDWRAGLALLTIECHDYLALLWQRGGDVFDAEGRVIIDSDLAVDTLEFYVGLFGGARPAAGTKLSSWTEDYAALARGQFLAYPAPDWMLATMQLDARTMLEGRVQCLPLPAWEPGGCPTSTGGGTAMLIPRGCPDVERAWELLKLLYFDRESLLRRFRTQSIVPPVRAIYDDPAFDEPAPFFQGQPVGRLLTRLAERAPAVNGSPYSSEGFTFLNEVFSDVVHGRITPRAALTGVATRLRALMARDQQAIEAAEARP